MIGSLVGANFSRQPQGSVSTRPRKERFLSYGVDCFDVKRNVPLKNLASSQSVGVLGKNLFVPSGSTWSTAYWEIPALTLPTNFTLVWAGNFVIQTSGGLCPMLDNDDYFGAQRHFQLRAYCPGAISTLEIDFIRFDTGVNSAYTASTVVGGSDTARAFVVIATCAGASMALYSRDVNERVLRSGSNTIGNTPSTSTQSVLAGQTKAGSTTNGNGTALWAILDGAVSASEAGAICADPWGKLFVQPRIPFPNLAVVGAPFPPWLPELRKDSGNTLTRM